jgi:hypothetical protein
MEDFMDYLESLEDTKQVIKNLEKMISEKIGEDIQIFSVVGCDCRLKDDRIYCIKKDKLVDELCILKGNKDDI